MSRIAVELVPRDNETLLRDFEVVRETAPEVSAINLPDLLRMPVRSWEGAATLRAAGPLPIIPHVRAIDIAPGAPLPGAEDEGLREVLIIAGDPPPDETHRVYPNTSEEIIARYRREAPHLTVYGAFDPYRRAPYQELEALQRKRDAGASGFFTQPLFDRRLLELSASWLEKDTVFWGVSPVIGPKSRAYWERVNHVVFPSDFEPTLDANIAFAREVLQFARARNDNAYLMPLRVDLAKYLTPLRDAMR
ncbi:methylenetetrahydrofolate reductase [Kozakia baliensis]|uniref:Methylenetetrahydrofolate reductase n=1 Tax=Kozakia baliensis TaxID=153496 RepID=A0A1D8UQ65_9PROT|nr:methylenetetrahydrofolate reductase [Kozakia baliensis]AOX15784.1 methylenetetrahydrofolate reductase [Kozakia baliensis]GBR24116.1 5,10-methylenetetrahydrofolate reductase [Kozakia baliensis NRIC 0488]GEL64606.1 methylenetetrahydrofolate reductase [Kozakia baliensis]